ncbi:MAG: hypothetical protein GX448_00660 [Planctomycetes bacterium]|nr:hypothetical protein [Planctomycetota bacterium]
MRIESRRKALLYLIAVFLVGAAIGGAGGYWLGRTVKARLPSAEEFENAMFRGLKSELALTAEQEGDVRIIVHETVQELAGHWIGAVVQTVKTVENCQHRLEPVLDERQRAKLSELVQRGREGLRAATNDGETIQTRP